MDKNQRVVLFSTYILVLFGILYFNTKQFIPSEQHEVIILSSLLMLSFTVLFLEHFFTRPTDVLASTISILLLLAPIKAQLSKFARVKNLGVNFHGRLDQAA